MTSVRTSDPVADKAVAISAAAQHQYDRISGDRSLSAEGKAAKLAPIYLEAKAQMDQIRQSVNQQMATRARDAERKAFAPPTDPLRLMSYHNAVAQAKQIADAQIANHELGRALTLGDDVMAKAIAFAANEKGWGNVVDTYTSAVPTAADAFKELSAVQAETAPLANFAREGWLRVPKPAEFAQLQDHQIARFAEPEQ
jgi:hypothetical protein